jgi:hypothetical protein
MILSHRLAPLFDGNKMKKINFYCAPSHRGGDGGVLLSFLEIEIKLFPHELFYCDFFPCKWLTRHTHLNIFCGAARGMEVFALEKCLKFHPSVIELFSAILEVWLIKNINVPSTQNLEPATSESLSSLDVACTGEWRRKQHTHINLKMKKKYYSNGCVYYYIVVKYDIYFEDKPKTQEFTARDSHTKCIEEII